MSVGYNLPKVTDLCVINKDALSQSRSDQVEHLSSVKDADLAAARKFYDRNHVTQGMADFLRGAMKRLAGKSQQALFELRQAMGGGKTHNMIALGLLARFPELREHLPDTITKGMDDEPAVIVTLSGRDVEKHIVGDIAEQVGKAEEFRDNWADGPKPMSEGNWMRLIGDGPTLIMLDELPTYLAVAHTMPFGKGTHLDAIKYNLANLFSAVMKCKRCVVVVASLEASYVDAQKMMSGLLNDLKNEISRGARSITPVDLSTGEIYDILRKRLFTKIPEPGGADVDAVVQAYLAVYKEGIKGNALAKSAEQMADEIVGSYPFHPSYKDILSLFKENEKFRQTRGLIQFTANLLQSVLTNQDDEVFLVGTQHLNFTDKDIREQVREIERTLESALACDVYTDNGASHAQVIDADRGDRAASHVAALMFVSSLSDNVDGIRGLPQSTVVEYLVAPGKEPTMFIEAFEALRDNCWYLHNRDGDRWYFSDIANVRKQIDDKEGRISDDLIYEEMRRRLTEIFLPVDKVAYTDLVALPRIDEVNLTPSKRICLVLAPDTRSPPEAAARFFENAIYKNAFFVVAGDGSEMANAEKFIRRILAIASVKTIVTDTPRHQKEIEDEQERAEIGFNTAVKILFNAVWYPQTNKLKSARIDLGHFQEKGIIQGEKAIESALAGTGAQKLREPHPDKMDGLIQRCEEMLFPDKQTRIRWQDMIERAATETRWIWLPQKGLDEIKAAALADRRWSEEDGYVDKNPPPPMPGIRVTEHGSRDSAGESELEFAISNAGKSPEIRVAPTRKSLDQGEIIHDRTYRTKEVEHWFLVRNTETGDTSEPRHWTGSIDITHQPIDNAGMWRVTLKSQPDAELRWNIRDTNAKDGTVYDKNPIEIDGSKKTNLCVYAKKGSVTARRIFELGAVDAKKTINNDLPANVRQDFQFSTRASVYRVLQVSKTNGEILFRGVSVTVGDGARSLSVRSGGEVALTGENLESIIKGLCEALGGMDVELQLRFTEAEFPDGYTMKDFAKKVEIGINVDDVRQEN